ncbi:MAG: PPC domain-containing protein [Planctomycetaceae bacterium]|nr:PPC domain-containing protein [Planctomycetaceae bacterium]
MRSGCLAILVLIASVSLSVGRADEGPVDPPASSYIFPAGGQRGTDVNVRIGALNLHGGGSFRIVGEGVTADSHVEEMETLWFEGPQIFLPASKSAENYPKDHGANIEISPHAPVGKAYWQLWTSQGAVPGRPFVIGDLPEVVEEEIDGQPIPVDVELPVTINGRIFPREDIDIWRVHAEAGESITCDVNAARIMSRLDSRLEVRDPQGRQLIENDDHTGPDSHLRFVAPVSGTYEVRIHDIAYGGLQDYVYRLTITKGQYIDHVFPLGGRSGEVVNFECDGQQVSNETKVSLHMPGGAGAKLVQLDLNETASNPIRLEVSNCKEYVESDASPSATIDLVEPIVLNGRIREPGEVDRWKLHVNAGKPVSFELKAASLGSRLDAQVRICDEQDTTLVEAGSTRSKPVEPTGSFTPENDGACIVEICHVAPDDAGDEYAYRLTLSPAGEPDFDLQLPADALTLFRGAEAKLNIPVNRVNGFDRPVRLTVEGLPEGVTANEVVVAGDQTSGEIVLTAADNAPITGVPIRVSGVALSAEEEEEGPVRGAPLPAKPGDPVRDDVLLAVCLPTPFKMVGDQYRIESASRGTIHRRPFVIQRGDYQGPLKIRLADKQERHLQGVTADEMLVPAGVFQFEYAIKIPTWLEMSRLGRVVVTAVGEITDEQGRHHNVSTSTTPSDDQIIILTAPAPLSVSVSPKSLAVTRDSMAEVAVTVKRGLLTDRPVSVELLTPPHIQGVSADPVQLDDNETQATLNLHVGLKAGPLNMPLTIRVLTQDDHGDPVIAECDLELVANASP